MLIELALQAQGALDMVCGAARIELPQKPLALLRRRQRQGLAALRGGQPRDGFDARCIPRSIARSITRSIRRPIPRLIARPIAQFSAGLSALGQAAAQRAGAVRQARVIE